MEKNNVFTIVNSLPLKQFWIVLWTLYHRKTFKTIIDVIVGMFLNHMVSLCVSALKNKPQKLIFKQMCHNLTE